VLFFFFFVFFFFRYLSLKKINPQSELLGFERVGFILEPMTFKGGYLIHS